MEKICRLRRLLFFIIFACFISLWGLQSTGATVQSLPDTITNFDLGHPNAIIRVDVKVTEHRPYKFYLNVYYKGRAEQAKVIKLVGDGSRYPDGRYGNPGLIIPILLKITNERGSTVDDGVHNIQGIDVHGFDGSRDGYYSRYIHTVELRPGIYHIEIRAMKVIPEFSGVSCAIHVGWHPKTKVMSE